MPLSPARLKSLCGTSAAYEKGKLYAAQRRVRLLQVSSQKISALVRGSAGHIYNVHIVLDQKENELDSYDCDCPAFERFGGLCKHLVAAVLFYQEIKRNRYAIAWSSPTSDATSDYAVNALLQSYTQRKTNHISAQLKPPEEKSTLDVTMEIDEYGIRLAFRVGASRLYVLQDLEKFVEHMQNNDIVALSKKFSLLHDASSFHEEAIPLLNFVIYYYPISKLAISQRSYFLSNPKKRMYLPPILLDEFIKLFVGKKLPVKYEERAMLLEVQKKQPPLKLRLQRQNNLSFLLSCADDFLLLQGASQICIILEDILYFCDVPYSDTCGELLNALQNNRYMLRFTEKDMPALYTTILTQVKPYIDLQTDEDLDKYEPLPLETEVYLDIPSPDYITAKMLFVYGENKHDAFGEKRVAQSLDLAGEIRAENVMKKFFSGFDKMNNEVYIREDTDAAYRLVEEGLAQISEFAHIYATPAFNKMQVHIPGAVGIGVRLDHGLLQVDFDMGGLDLSELSAILASCRLAKKYHRLKDGSFLKLEGSALPELADLAEGLDLNGKELAEGHAQLHCNRALYLDSAIKKSDRIHYDRDSDFRQVVRGMRSVEDADFETPVQLRRILRNYQKNGYRWLRTIDAYGFGGILADDMGLGKTLQVLALLQSRKDEPNESKPSIVVCPSSLVLNWESESHRFTPDLRCTTVTGNAAQRLKTISQAEEYDLLVTSYDLLKRDIDAYTALDFYYIILDEAQYIKNHTTQNAKSAKLLRGRTRFALTGTPVENSLAELWSIFEFIMPGYLYSYGKFRQKLEEPIVRQSDAAASARLRELVRPFILRRLKKEVLTELPDKTETVLRAALGAEQKKLYLANLAQAKKELSTQMGVRQIAVLAALTRLRQICCDPSLLYSDYKGGSVKLDLCIDLVQNCVESGHRLLLFSQFTSMLDIVAKRLKALGIAYYTLQGSTKPSERLSLVNAFNSGETPVFLISLKAGGTGLNLTGADVVIHYDPWWNLSAQNQATDRAYRIGQKNSVQVYKLICSGTVEERILEMQRDKEALANEVVQGQDGSLTHMSQEEILSLFN